MTATFSDGLRYLTKRIFAALLVAAIFWLIWIFALEKFWQEHPIISFAVFTVLIAKFMFETVFAAAGLALLSYVFFGVVPDWLLTAVLYGRILGFIFIPNRNASQKKPETEPGLIEKSASGMTGAYVYGENARTVRGFARWLGL